MKHFHSKFIAIGLVAALAACSGGGLPNGPVVNSPGQGSGGSSPKLVNVKVSVTVPSAARQRIRPDYISVNTRSLVIQLASVDGKGVTGANPVTIETAPHAKNCAAGRDGLVCTGIASGSPGQDVFAVTTYEAAGATGAVLSVGTVQANIAPSGGGVPITNQLSLALAGVIASLELSLTPNAAKRGAPATSQVSLQAFDASGAQIVGPSDFESPITLAVQGDTENAFALRAAGRSGPTLSIGRPTSNITLRYDGNAQAASVTIAATVDGPSISASANFTLRGKTPPPPIGTIYALNFGSSAGLGATVTEYDGKASGDAAPERTLELSSKLYARSIAVDAQGDLFVGYFDNEFGFSPSSGAPDKGNEIAVFAPDAEGNASPVAVITADKTSKTTIFPAYLAFDPSGNLVTYGASAVDGNAGNNAVLTYSAESEGATAPLDAFGFVSPTLFYAGPTGLAIDGSGNFYVNGALHTSLGPDDGLFVAPASDADNPAVNPSRTIPWDSTTRLELGLTTDVALDSSGEIFIGTTTTQGSGSSTSCQAHANVYSAGASGGVTDVPPLRSLTLTGVFTQNPECNSSRDPLTPYFPSIELYGSTLFVADDFNNAIDAFQSSAHGVVEPHLKIAGDATGLNAPVALVITSLSGRERSGIIPRAHFRQ
ncbi:MAG: hypothetical protein JOZ77_10135 [Candidatus Eremiobacteraeota bacterium]|nr:hypothetical protein [Candidatus Eremiobacteraeota bacterium]